MVQAVADGGREGDGGGVLLGDLKPWAASNHEILLFSARTGALHVLGLKTQRMRQAFHPLLLKYLEGFAFWFSLLF
jgi:hypothetical protein